MTMVSEATRAAITLSLIFCCLLVGSYTDAKQRIIPNTVPVAILIIGAFVPGFSVVERLVSLAIMVFALIMAKVVTKKSSGGGDIKLYCSLAFAVGIVYTILVMALAMVFMFIHNAIHVKTKIV